MKNIKKIKGSTPELTRLQSNLENWATNVQKSGLTDGLQLNAVFVSTGGVVLVEHKLGRAPLGYIVVGRDANAQIWDAQATNVFKTKSLALLSDADVTINLWVY